MQKFTQKELNTFNHEAITKCAQNVHHEPLHKQRDSDATYWRLQQQLNGPVTLLCLSLFQFCNMLLLTSQVKVLHRLWWKSNCSCVDCGLRNKSSKFHKTSSAATQIVLKILRLFSCENNILRYYLLGLLCYILGLRLFFGSPEHVMTTLVVLHQKPLAIFKSRSFNADATSK